MVTFLYLSITQVAKAAICVFQPHRRADASIASWRNLRGRRTAGQAWSLHQGSGVVAVARRQGQLAHLRVQRLQVGLHWLTHSIVLLMKHQTSAKIIGTNQYHGPRFVQKLFLNIVLRTIWKYFGFFPWNYAYACLAHCMSKGCIYRPRLVFCKLKPKSD